MRAFIRSCFAALLGSLGTLVAGCDPGAGSAPTTFHELAVALTQADCEADQRCCGTTCSANLDRTFNRAGIDTQSLIDQGSVAYDAKAGIECLNAYRRLYANCDVPNDSFAVPSACAHVLTGVGAVGDHCTSDEECVGTAYCGFSSTCTAWIGPNGDCSSGRCAPGTTCDFSSQLCLVPAGQGKGCGHLPCDQSGTPLVCGPKSTCVVPLGDGSPCTTGTECWSGKCEGVPKPTCQPLPYRDTLRAKLCGGP